MGGIFEFEGLKSGRKFLYYCHRFELGTSLEGLLSDVLKGKTTVRDVQLCRRLLMSSISLDSNFYLLIQGHTTVEVRFKTVSCRSTPPN
jgi:hypothetical protein